ncbi:MAG: HAD family hydrolase [candidate division Zixibacteria bacterium]|nr:HAD family hydrolase [candidate division Zixibacteria bacterium]
MPVLRPIRHLIFDLDGTLIDSSRGVVDAVNYSLRLMNQPEQPAGRIRAFIGYPLEVMYPEFTDAPLAELRHHFQIRARETMVSSTVALPDVDRTLTTLKDAGYRLAVATTKIQRHVGGILDRFGWSSLFDVTVGADDVEQVKPSPDAFILAMYRMGASPSDSIAIGDTINDIAAAQAVPMRVVAVTSPYGDNSEMLARNPDHHLESVAELPALLNKLSS